MVQRRGLAAVKKLIECARISRVEKVIRPYLEVVFEQPRYRIGPPPRCPGSSAPPQPDCLNLAYFDVILVVEYNEDWSRHMETVQIVLDKELLRATDQAALRTRRNRSALVRDALREHLRRLAVREMEERDREGFSSQPSVRDESLAWEAEAAWPAE
jgi:predicted transcriptional regulator